MPAFLPQFGHHKVGRRADEGEHSAHRAGEGQRHEQTRRIGAGGGTHAHHYGHHQRHRAGVAHECPYGGSRAHDKEIHAHRTVAGKAHHAAAYYLCQTRAQHRAAHHEQPHHHHHYRIAETRQSLGHRKDAGKRKHDERPESDNVGTYAAVDKQHGRSKERKKRKQHKSEQGF